MSATFVINHLENGVRLEFKTRTDRIPLFIKIFTNVAEANECIKMLQEEIKPDRFRVYMSKKRKYTFEVRCKGGNTLLESHPYLKCQSAWRGAYSMIRTMRQAGIKEVSYH